LVNFLRPAPEFERSVLCSTADTCWRARPHNAPFTTKEPEFPALAVSTTRSPETSKDLHDLNWESIKRLEDECCADHRVGTQRPLEAPAAVYRLRLFVVADSIGRLFTI
jgi:hypothetical protein